MKSINADGFDDNVRSVRGPVLVDFWAPWCGPCQAISISLQEIAGKRDDIEIIKIDADQNRPLASELNVRSIPTLILFRDGQAVASHVGAASTSTLESWIDRCLAPSGAN